MPYTLLSPRVLFVSLYFVELKVVSCKTWGRRRRKTLLKNKTKLTIRISKQRKNSEWLMITAIGEVINAKSFCFTAKEPEVWGVSRAFGGVVFDANAIWTASSERAISDAFRAVELYDRRLEMIGQRRPNQA